MMSSGFVPSSFFRGSEAGEGNNPFFHIFTSSHACKVMCFGAKTPLPLSSHMQERISKGGKEKKAVSHIISSPLPLHFLGIREGKKEGGIRRADNGHVVIVRK